MDGEEDNKDVDLDNPLNNPEPKDAHVMVRPETVGVSRVRHVTELLEEAASESLVEILCRGIVE